MMGQDCSRIVNILDDIKDTLTDVIVNIGNIASYQITTTGEHGEVENPNSNSGFASAVPGLISKLSDDLGKMNTLRDKLYVSPEQFNTLYGSPWKEINKLKESLEKIINEGSSVTWLGDRIKALGLVTIALSRSVDAKYVMIIYQDYIQRGYDDKFNNKNPSVTTQLNIDTKTFGNVKQDYTENVNFKPKPVESF